MFFNPKIKIFLVDDDRSFANGLKQKLTAKDNRYEVHHFESGEACLQQLRQQPSVVVLDYFFRSVRKKAANGLQILKTIKAREPDTHVIMLSGQGRFGLAAQTLMRGAYAYIIKDEKAFDKTGRVIGELMDD